MSNSRYTQRRGFVQEAAEEGVPSQSDRVTPIAPGCTSVRCPDNDIKSTGREQT